MKKFILGCLAIYLQVFMYAQVEINTPEPNAKYLIGNTTTDPFICGISTVSFIYNGSPVTYGTVVSVGRCWLDRNLGASQVATSTSDAAAYGDLFQWGRGADGHQIINPPSLMTSTLSGTDSPGNSSFILTSDEPHDWRSPQNNNLWQGVNGINNPCPSGFRLPTTAELETESQSWVISNSEGAFASTLKLPAAGFRNDYNGWVMGAGFGGVYWSDSIEKGSSNYLYFSDDCAKIGSKIRGNGFSIRCIKD